VASVHIDPKELTVDSGWDERERDAVDLCVLRLEQAISTWLVAAATQTPTHDLFAEQLAAEAPNAENLGNRIGVPAFRQHRHRDYVANLLAESPALD
jgi:hypothetical protein